MEQEVRATTRGAIEMMLEYATHLQIKIRWFQGGKGNIPVFLQSCGGNTKANGWIWPEGEVRVLCVPFDLRDVAALASSRAWR